MRRYIPITPLLLLAAACTDTMPTPTAPDPSYDQIAAAPIVNSLNHPGDGVCDEAECTLIEAIMFASSGATITFAPGVTGTIAGRVGISNKSLTIIGPGSGALTIDADGNGAGLVVTGFPDTIDVEIRGITVANGWTRNVSGIYLPLVAGGGVSVYYRVRARFHDVVITNSRVDDYWTRETAGGGLGIMYGARVWLIDCTITGNSGGDYGGGIYVGRGQLTLSNTTVSGNVAGEGSGIFISGEGTAAIDASTITGNHSGYGSGSIANVGVLSVENTTVSANTGTGVFTRENGQSTITHSTISGNESHLTFAGGLQNAATATTTVSNSIIAGNANQNGANNCIGAITDDGYNVESGADCGFSHPASLSNIDPLLGPLADNGGATRTHALLSGSPAIDLIGVAACAGPNTDQRGMPRPAGAGCDAGAFEAQAWVFSGFFTPVGNPPTVNTVKAGQAVPVKFSLGANRGLNILRSGYPASEQVACDLSSGTSAVEVTMTAGSSSLSYDEASNSYTYVWKTEKAWANTCRRLTLRLNDEAGTSRTADFRLTK